MQCPHCKNDDERLITYISATVTKLVYICEVCSKHFLVDKK